MNKDFDNLIVKLSTDITNSLKTNLSVYVEKNEKNNDLLQNFKMLLFKLPELYDENEDYILNNKHINKKSYKINVK